jgi:hypothetical protein
MKDSFILYLEQKEIFDELDNEEAGELIKAIFEYQSTGETPNLSKSLKLAFIPIKNSLDRNESKWEDEKQRRREAGRLGGLAKASNAKNATNNSSKPSNAKNATEISSTTWQSLANLADNVYVNVNDNVNDNVNVKKGNISAPSSFKETDSELFIELPLIDKTHFPIYSKDLEKWSSIYPAVDIEQEFRNMFGWLNSNPKNRKTKTGISRFINNWLSRSQDRARTVSSSVPIKSNDVASNSTLLKTYSENTDIETMDDDEFLAYINGSGR